LDRLVGAAHRDQAGEFGDTWTAGGERLPDVTGPLLLTYNFKPACRYNLIPIIDAGTKFVPAGQSEEMNFHSGQIHSYHIAGKPAESNQ